MFFNLPVVRLQSTLRRNHRASISASIPRNLPQRPARRCCSPWHTCSGWTVLLVRGPQTLNHNLQTVLDQSHVAPGTHMLRVNGAASTVRGPQVHGAARRGNGWVAGQRRRMALRPSRARVYAHTP